MNDIIAEFQKLLARRFERQVPTTEDSVRYTFFAALLARGISPDEVVMEFPHPRIKRARIDTWLPAYEGRALAIEFKYDRELPGFGNQPRTMKAGHVFKDLGRQVLLSQADTRSFFVYVTSDEMAVYFRNSRNGHQDFWNLQAGAAMTIDAKYLEGKPATFWKTLGPPFSARVTGQANADLPGGNYLRIYEVTPDSR